MKNKKKLKVYDFLSSFKGFNKKTIYLICYECGVFAQSSLVALTKNQKDFVLNWIDANLSKQLFGQKLALFEANLRTKLKNSGRVKAHRFFSGLPVRGQRTKTNARTAKKINGALLYFVHF